MSKLSDWLLRSLYVAFIGEIYPQIRAIAVRYLEDESLLIRYYLDREPTDFDVESIETAATNLDATLPLNANYKILTECLYSDQPLKDIDSLDGFFFSRREYEIGNNPSQNPTYI